MDLRPSSTLQKGRRGRKGKGPYVGVRARGGRWVSEIRVPRTGIRVWLGSHRSAESAARAYDAALYCLRGEEACFNFPYNERPNLGDREVGSLSVEEIQNIAARFSWLDEMVARLGPSTHPSVVPTAFSDLTNLNEMPVDEVKGKLCASGCMPEADPHVTTVVPEELHIATSALEEKQYVPTFVSEEQEPYIPAFVPGEELHVPAFAPEAALFPHGVTPFDEWFATDEDWMENFHSGL
ncbi:hypothetical protein NMG60_11005107 [Bertholletia excelsa]